MTCDFARAMFGLALMMSALTVGTFITALI